MHIESLFGETLAEQNRKKHWWQCEHSSDSVLIKRLLTSFADALNAYLLECSMGRIHGRRGGKRPSDQFLVVVDGWLMTGDTRARLRL